MYISCIKQMPISPLALPFYVDFHTPQKRQKEVKNIRNLNFVLSSSPLLLRFTFFNFREKNSQEKKLKIIRQKILKSAKKISIL